jgi:hypothetical protein
VKRALQEQAIRRIEAASLGIEAKRRRGAAALLWIAFLLALGTIKFGEGRLAT